MPPEVQSSSVALNPSNNPRFKNKVILKRPHTVLMRLSWGIQGGNGNGITFVDMEYGWLLNHEDLLHQKLS